MHSADRATKADKTDIVVVDDSPLVRRRISEKLAQHPEFNVIAEGVDVTQLDELLDASKAAVAIVDVDASESDVMTILRAIAARFDGTKFLLLSEYPQDWPLTRVAQTRAVGLLDKKLVESEIVPGVRATLQGLFVSSSLHTTEDAVVELPKQQTIDLAESPESILTDRELEVLSLMAEGLGNREIGNHLFISENTVKNHVRSILEKLNQHSRMAAVIYAVRQRILHIT